VACDDVHGKPLAAQFGTVHVRRRKLTAYCDPTWSFCALSGKMKRAAIFLQAGFRVKCRSPAYKKIFARHVVLTTRIAQA
jgi:hypothetical protein